jgi:hypothetical protein
MHLLFMRSVTESVFRTSEAYFLTSEAQMPVCRHYEGKAPGLDCGLFRYLRANHGLYSPMLLRGWDSDKYEI